MEVVNIEKFEKRRQELATGLIGLGGPACAAAAAWDAPLWLLIPLIATFMFGIIEAYMKPVLTRFLYSLGVWKDD